MENKVIYNTYGRNEYPTIVEHGVYKDRAWCIRMHDFPCAYVEKRIGDSKRTIDEAVHYGITWEDSLPNSENQEIMLPYANREFWGWDYGHCEDYRGEHSSNNRPTNKKWTSEEIINEIYKAVDNLEERKTKDEKLKKTFFMGMVKTDGYEIFLLKEIINYAKENDIVEPQDKIYLDNLENAINRFIKEVEKRSGVKL